MLGCMVHTWSGGRRSAAGRGARFIVVALRPSLYGCLPTAGRRVALRGSQAGRARDIHDPRLPSCPSKYPLALIRSLSAAAAAFVSVLRCIAA